MSKKSNIKSQAFLTYHSGAALNNKEVKAITKEFAKAGIEVSSKDKADYKGKPIVMASSGWYDVTIYFQKEILPNLISDTLFAGITVGLTLLWTAIKGKKGEMRTAQGVREEKVELKIQIQTKEETNVHVHFNGINTKKTLINSLKQIPKLIKEVQKSDLHPMMHDYYFDAEEGKWGLRKTDEISNKNKIQADYKDSPVGMIPNDWEISNISRSFKICNNLRLPISEEERKKIKGIYPYYGPTKIQDYINEYRVDGKYALIGEDGDHFLKWKELPMTLLVSGKFNVNNHAHIIQGGKNLTEWFYYFFNQRELTPHLTRQGAGRYKLSKTSLEKIPCVLPPIEEQKKITTLLSTWDNAIQLTNQLIAQKELRKKYLMQQLLIGKKRFKGFKGKWKEYYLSDFFNERNETGNLEMVLLSIGQNGVYPQSESIKKDTSNEDKSKYKKIKPGDIGYNTMRMWQGRSALSNLEGIVSPAYTIVTPKKNADSLFFAYLFKTPKLMNLFWRNSQGLVDDTLNCKFKDFSKVKFILPEKEEQKQIALLLRKCDQHIQYLQNKLNFLKEQRKGLMQMLLTGKKRLKYKIKP